MRDELSNIGQIAQRYGLTLRTLRFYEQQRLLQPIRKGTSRLYTARDRVRLELILKGRKLGFSLSEIAALIAAAPDSSIDKEALVAGLTAQQLRAQLALLEQQRAIVQAGIDDLRRALRGMISRSG